MEHINTILIDEDMKNALLEWIRQFSDEDIQWSNLMDGILLNAVMDKINPGHVPNFRRESTSDECARPFQLWTRLVDVILNFYQDPLQYLVFVKPPDIQLICRDPCSDGALREVEVAVLMILGCAVQCNHKKQFVEQIRSLGASYHPAIVKCIKEITSQPEHFVHISQMNSDQFPLISKNLRNFTNSRQELMARVMKLTSEVNALKELQKKDGKTFGDDANNKHESLNENDDRDKTIELIEIQNLKIKELQNLLDEKTKDLADVTSDLEKSKQKITLLEQQNLTLTQEVSANRTYRDELEIANEKASKLSQLERKNSKLQKKLADLDFWKQHASYLSEENDKLSQLKDQLDSNMHVLKKKYEDLKFYETEVERYERELKDMAEAREMDRELIRELSSGKAKLEIENNNLLSALGNRSFTSEKIQNATTFDQLEQYSFSNKKSTKNDDETAKLDEGFATLYDLDVPHGDRRSSNQIETARLIDIDGSQSEVSTQTERFDRRGDSDDEDLQNKLNRRRSWMIGSEERKINATVENLSKEIKKLKDFVKLKDASILLMKLKADEKAKECAEMAAEIEECKKKHQLEIDHLKTQNLSESEGREIALKSEVESVKSRLSSAQVKIENLKREREQIQKELNSFNERVTQLIIENNRLLAQHEASVMVCGKVEDENMKLLDQLRDTLNQNQDLLVMILTSRDHHAEEQKSYIEQLSELKHSKEKLEDKILEQLRKKEKKLGIGTLVRKIKNKNKPTKSEQFLMSLESPSRSSEPPSEQSFEDSEFRKYLEERTNLFNQRTKDSSPNVAYISTTSLLPQKPPRARDLKPSFSHALKSNLAHNKRLFQSEMNVSNFVDIKSADDKDALAKESGCCEQASNDGDMKCDVAKVTRADENVKDDTDSASCKNEQSQLSDNETLQNTPNILKKDEKGQVDESQVLHSEIQQHTLDPESTAVKKKNHVTINVIKDNEDFDETIQNKTITSPTLPIQQIHQTHERKRGHSDTPSLGRFKTSEDLRREGVSSDLLPGQSQTSQIKTIEIETCETKSQEKFSPARGISKDLRSTSIPGAPELLGSEGNQFGHGFSRRPHLVKQFRAFSEWNIQPPKIKQPEMKLPTIRSSVQSAFSAAGKKIAREMSHLREKVTSKDFGKAKPSKDSPKLIDKERSQTLTSEFRTESNLSKKTSSTGDSCRKSHFDEPNLVTVDQTTSKLTFDNLAERRPAKVEVCAEVTNKAEMEVTVEDNKDQIDDSVLIEPQKKNQAPVPTELLPGEGKPLSTSSTNSSVSLSEESVSPPAFLAEAKVPMSSTSSSSSPSPELPYRESKVCI